MKKLYEYNLTKKAMPFDIDDVKISTSKNAEEIIRKFYHDDIGIYESFFCLFLNRASRVTGYVKISQGGVAGTYVDPVLVAKYMIESLTSGIIMAHNHPSGQLKASEQDIQITNKVKQVIGIFGGAVLDHIILTENGYYSFADNGLI